jgi:hypothetical protein
VIVITMTPMATQSSGIMPDLVSALPTKCHRTSDGLPHVDIDYGQLGSFVSSTSANTATYG